MTAKFASESIERLMEEFAKLPGIGRKSAQRLALYVLKIPRAEAQRFASSIMDVKDRVGYCSVCGNVSESERCSICTDGRREKGVVCVVEQPSDIMAIEKTGEYRGLYHVLLGAISPLDGIGPDEIRIRELVKRVDEEKPVEVIVATNPTAQGETTAVYISQVLKHSQVKVTRIARGLPVGSDIEYCDQQTLSKAFEGRKEL
ncbi:MAG: recombination protein RecR [Candidatus Eiseniibacteriota bacterium]|nr:MAG: recombination protein RecR [Candidatus Eisenbacteria bacterium]